MISVYNIKPQFQRILTPILTYLHRHRTTANQITISACFLSLLIGAGFWFADTNRLLFLVLPVGLLLRMALNALDGMMARKYNQITCKGEMLNELGDSISDLFVFFPLLKFQPESLYLVVVFIALSIINEYAGIMGKVIAGERRYEGPMGKSDRAFLMGVYGLLNALGIGMGSYAPYIIGIVILLLCVSTWIRIRKTLQKIAK